MIPRTVSYSSICRGSCCFVDLELRYFRGWEESAKCFSFEFNNNTKNASRGKINHRVQLGFHKTQWDEK
jgi:hypothetical protein